MTGKTLLSVDDLARAGLLTPSDALRAVAARYSVAVTPQIGGADRPRRRERPHRAAVPARRARTGHASTVELADPIGDDAHSPVPGLVHRYRDRVLLKLLSVCPVYCRFCFRRETVGQGKGGVLPDDALDAALKYIAARPEIFEVILTGGDPLAASARRLREVATRLAAITHVKLLRVHTRVPTAAPGLVTPERLEALRASGKALYVALHVNHPRELTRARARR